MMEPYKPLDYAANNTSGDSFGWLGSVSLAAGVIQIPWTFVIIALPDRAQLDTVALVLWWSVMLMPSIAAGSFAIACFAKASCKRLEAVAGIVLSICYTIFIFAMAL